MEDLLTKAELATPWLYGGLLIALRLAACLALLPEIGGRMAPMRVRLALVVLATVALDSGLGLVAVPLPNSALSVIVAAAREVVLGAALGLAVRLINATVQMAGDLAGLSMGLSLATLFDLSAGEAPNAMGRLFGLIASLLFFAVGGHLIVIGALFEHLRHYPVGDADFVLPSLEAIAEAGSHAIRTAVLLSAPVLVVALLLNVAMGFVMRVVPSMNLFNIGIGVLLISGLVALGVESETVRVFFEREIEGLPEAMHRLAGGGP